MLKMVWLGLQPMVPHKATQKQFPLHITSTFPCWGGFFLKLGSHLDNLHKETLQKIECYITIFITHTSLLSDGKRIERQNAVCILTREKKSITSKKENTVAIWELQRIRRWKTNRVLWMSHMLLLLSLRGGPHCAKYYTCSNSQAVPLPEAS